MTPLEAALKAAERQWLVQHPSAYWLPKVRAWFRTKPWRAGVTDDEAKAFAAQLVPYYVIEGVPASGAAALDTAGLFEALERIHPAVARDVREWMEDQARAGQDIRKDDLRAEIVEAILDAPEDSGPFAVHPGDTIRQNAAKLPDPDKPTAWGDPTAIREGK